MTGAIRTRRKNNFNLFKEARKLASFDEFPLLRLEVDPQVHVSSNHVDQPFFLTGQKDMVLAQVSGASRVEFSAGPVRYFDLVPGEFVYIPANSEHRILTREPGAIVRYKAAAPGIESVSMRCVACDQVLFRRDFNASEAPAQFGYHAAVSHFNSEETVRVCSSCGTVAPLIDVAPFRWEEVGNALINMDDGGDEEELPAH